MGGGASKNRSYEIRQKRRKEKTRGRKNTRFRVFYAKFEDRGTVFPRKSKLRMAHTCEVTGYEDCECCEDAKLLGSAKIEVANVAMDFGRDCTGYPRCGNPLENPDLSAKDVKISTLPRNGGFD